MLEILEFAQRAKEGITEPVLSRLSDEEFYYVKGRTLLPKGLISEWICARLGRLVGLRIPDFELAMLPVFPPGAANLGLPIHLGFGPIFASKRVMNVNSLDFLTAQSIPVEMRRNVAAFDYWIGNEDRTLTEKGGNPNLFMEIGGGEPIVIDHNLAFDPAFSLENLKDLHVFRKDLEEILSDSKLKTRYATRFTDALTHWGQVVNELPEAWMYSDASMEVEADIDLQAMYAWLTRLCRPEGWGL